jgi:hypothetical protein
MPRLRDAASTWALLGVTACTAPQEPPCLCDPIEDIHTRGPNQPVEREASPVEVVASAETEPSASERSPAEQEPEPPSFEPASPPWRSPKNVVSRGGRGCSVAAELDPEILAVYSMIDVYALMAPDLEFRIPLPELAKRPPCTDGHCRPEQPNAVVIDDDGTSPIDGRAFGFVIPIGSGFWLLPLGQEYREYHCMPDVKTETIADGHARLTIRHQRGEEVDCDDVADDQACGVGCFYAGATQHDLFFDASKERMLLVTRRYDELGEFDDPTPVIEVVLDGDAVRIDGCRVEQRIPWPPT